MKMEVMFPLLVYLFILRVDLILGSIRPPGKQTGNSQEAFTYSCMSARPMFFFSFFLRTS